MCETHSTVRPPANYSLPLPGSAARANRSDRGEESEVFLPVPEAAAAMRRFVADVLRAWGEEELLWEANLIASELATNALIRGGSPFRAYVSRARGVVRMRVEDIGTSEPTGRTSATGMRDRGAAIVRKLADRWGYDEQAGATVTWVELHTDRANRA